MFKSSLGVSRMDKLRKEDIRGTVQVEQCGDKVKEVRLRWFSTCVS